MILIGMAADARGSLERRSLFNWLRADRELRPGVRVAMCEAEPAPDGMGTALDLIQLVVDSGFQTASLAVSIAAWRKACQPRTAMTIERDGITITVPEGSLLEAEDLLRILGEGRR